MPKEVKLGVVEQGDSITYVTLYKHLEDITNLNEETFRDTFKDLQFHEEIGVEYNSLPIYVGWTYVPVITDGIANVKLLKLEQGGNIAIILPEQVATTYKRIEEDPTKIDEIIQDIDIVGDVYGFDENDKELYDLIIKMYLNVGDSAPAFILNQEGELQYEEEKEGQDREEDGDRDTLGGFGGGRGGLDRDINKSFASVDKGTNSGLDIELEPEIEPNLEAFKRFSNDTQALELLIERLHNTTPRALRKHIRTKYIAESKVLVIEVDNKSIYDELDSLPKHARAQISNIGELLRTDEETQLLDSFRRDRGRVFVLAENTLGNAWVVRGEPEQEVGEKNTKRLYISRKNDIIVLERSNISQNNRKFIVELRA